MQESMAISDRRIELARRRRRKAIRRKRIRSFLTVTISISVIAVAAFMLYTLSVDRMDWKRTERAAEIKTFAKENGIKLSAYPERLIELYENNEETKNFVLEYPLKKDEEFDIDITGEIDSGSIPLFMQWDQRWGYTKYGSGMIGTSACGPVCLSMVAVHLTGDAKYDPKWVSKFSMDNGFYVEDNGTAWTLMSDGARMLGLQAKELPLEESIVADELGDGHPIICIMGEGDFTTSGHYIVLTGYYNGKVSVNDPNSYFRSEKLWTFADIKDQIRNLWSYKV